MDVGPYTRGTDDRILSNNDIIAYLERIERSPLEERREAVS